MRVCCAKIQSLTCFPFALTAEQADISRDFHGRVGEMSIAVPVILAIALAASLYGQAGVTWPNYQAEQNEKPEKSEENSSKDKAEKKSSEKSESGKFGQSSNTAASKGRRDARPRRQE
jgi:stringent starvation protein B